MTAISAIVATEPGPAQLRDLTEADLPDGDVTVAVSHSSLNYKDGLAVTGKGKVIRSYPMVCGIDLAGTVVESSSDTWRAGDEVVLTGWGLGETWPGGYTQRQRVRSEWLVRRPAGLTPAQTMAVGTAGLTAMLCVIALEKAGLTPDTDLEVLVTGAGGGVGSVAVAVLAGLGYRVAASTGRAEIHDHLRSLGASTIVAREELATAGRPLDKERWAGAVDTVGSQTLATALAQTRYGGSVAACGLVGGSDLPTTVLPFILRGVSLLGVDSVMCPTPRRAEAWERLGRDLPVDVLDRITTIEPLTRVPELAEEILAGATQGRVVIDTAR
ncbi:MDR family oxidoreductase [Microbacterium sp. X-17]|uniref:MDR family oxidoreductase n=1 Tax=Microbacterium sp. X-17 TaxID=3144404 RepID=UPI0031F595A8